MEILATHPQATEEDLDEFEELLALRSRIEPLPDDTLPRTKEVLDLEQKIAGMKERLFPHFEEALERAFRRRQGGGGVA